MSRRPMHDDTAGWRGSVRERKRAKRYSDRPAEAGVHFRGDLCRPRCERELTPRGGRSFGGDIDKASNWSSWVVAELVDECS